MQCDYKLLIRVTLQKYAGSTPKESSWEDQAEERQESASILVIFENDIKVQGFHEIH